MLRRVKPLVLSLDTANGTAINPADFGDLQNASYNAATNELTLTGPFTNGATVASLTVDAVDDTVFEGNEGYSVSLTSATVDGTTVSATGTQNTTITDNDAPTFTLSGDATVAEGASATYNIVLSGGDVASGENRGAEPGYRQRYGDQPGRLWRSAKRLVQRGDQRADADRPVYQWSDGGEPDG